MHSTIKYFQYCFLSSKVRIIILNILKQQDSRLQHFAV